MPTIYYVNTQTGNDANSGATWPLAWRSTTPLKTISNVATFTDVEVRFAQTPAYPLTLNEVSSGTPTSFGGVPDRCYTTAGPIPAGFTPTTLSSTASPPTIGSLGWQLIAPCTTASIANRTWAGELFIPVLAAGQACARRPTNAINLANFYQIELVMAKQNATAVTNLSLVLYSDNGATTILKTIPLTLPSIIDIDAWSFEPLILAPGTLGTGTVLSMAIISGATTAAVTTVLGALYFTQNRDSSTYFGLKCVLMPVTPNAESFPKIPVAFNGNQGAMQYLGMSLVTAAVPHYVYPYYTDSYLPALSGTTNRVYGTKLLPIKFLGGWDPTTNTVTGRTCVAGPLIAVMGISTHSCGIELANLIVHAPSPTLGFQATYYQSALGNYDLVLAQSVYLKMTDVHMTAPRFGQYPILLFAFSTATTLYEISMANCTTHQGPTGTDPDNTGGKYNFSASDTAFIGCNAGPASALDATKTPISNSFTNCVFVSTQNAASSSVNLMTLATVNTSKFFSRSTTAGQLSGTYTSFSTFNTCKFIGGQTVPPGFHNTFDACTFEVTKAGEFMTSNGNHDSMVIKNTPAHTPRVGNPSNTTGFFSQLRGTVQMDNCNMTCNFGSLLLSTGNINVTSLVINNSTFSLNGGNGATFINATSTSNTSYTGGRIYLDTVTLGLGWTSFLGGTSGAVSAQKMTMPPALKLITDVRLNDASRFTTFSNGCHTDISLTYEPTGTIWTTSSGLVDFDYRVSVKTPTTNTIYNPGFTLAKDTTVTRTGAYTWNWTLLAGRGSVVADRRYCEHLLGVFNVTALKQIIASIQVKRLVGTTRGWLYIRPMFTRLDKEDIKASSLGTIGVWETLTLGYTPTTSGSVAVFMSITGTSQNPAWFDDFKFVQV